MYGTTEVGVLIVNFPGLQGYTVKPTALGKPAPGWEVAIVDSAGQVLPPYQSGDIAVQRKGQWFSVKDRGYCDAEGYFYHEGRADDVIISAGWTMSAVEIEQTLLTIPWSWKQPWSGCRTPCAARSSRLTSSPPLPQRIRERTSRHL